MLYSSLDLFLHLVVYIVTILLANMQKMQSFLNKLGLEKKNTNLELEHDNVSPHQSQGGSYGCRDSQFYERVREATLNHLNVRLEVVRPLSTEYQYLKAPLSKMLEEGKDGAVAHNYSFESFKEIFERKINESTNDQSKILKSEPEHGVDMNYGKLGWFSGSGDYDRVIDQDSFSVALNGLYLNRGQADFLTFEYQMEWEEQKRKRLESDKLVVEIQEWNKRLPSVTTPPRRRQNLNEDSRPGTARTLQISPRTVTRRRTDSSSAGITADSSRQQGSSFDAGKARESVKNVLKGARLRGHEMKSEERERFKAMFVEKKRESYKRGGSDKETTDEEIRRISDIDREVADGEAEDPEQDIEEEEDEDIEIADRIVVK